jgi:hypothetical protein
VLNFKYIRGAVSAAVCRMAGWGSADSDSRQDAKAQRTLRLWDLWGVSHGGPPRLKRLKRGTHRGGQEEGGLRAGLKRSIAGFAFRPLNLRVYRVSRLGYYPSDFCKRIDSPSLYRPSPATRRRARFWRMLLAGGDTPRFDDCLARRLSVICLECGGGNGGRWSSEVVSD